MTSPSPDHIAVRGARVHNLKNVDVDIPLRELVAIAGVSGSGKSSLALGVLYAEGSRRYIEALSTYTRRRMAHAPRAAVDSVEHVPAALALRQRPGVPGVRSTFGTSTELLNVIRLMFSRLASHMCPNGHRVPPTIDVAAEVPFACPECGATADAPGAEQLAFNSEGACPTCTGTGVVRDVDDAALVPDESRTIDDGAVVPWQMFGFNVQPAIAREFGVRTDVPFRDLTEEERQIVFDCPEEKKHITVTTKNGVHELDFTFRNARLTVTEELGRATDEKRLKRVARFLTEGVCRTCHGTRLNDRARLPRIGEFGLADVTAMTLDDVVAWAPTVTATLPPDMPSNVDGLLGVMRDLLADGNSVVFVDHDVQLLREASWLIEIGPGSGADGGRIIAQGTAADLARSPGSLLTGEEPVVVRERAEESAMFDAGRIHLATGAIHTVHPLEVEIPRGRLVAVTGVSGSGKTTLVLESLVPALVAAADEDGERRLPAHVQSVDAPGIRRVRTVDATPIGINVRSTVATYSKVYDELRKAYAETDEAKRRGLTASDFSYNTGSLACPRCQGTGQVTLDVQFLPDVDIACPDCGGSRYAPEANEIRRDGLSLPDLLGLTVREALDTIGDIPRVKRRLQAPEDLCLGYLTLGEDTPALFGGEAQRLKLATQLQRDQSDAVFVLDEPSVGLHPLDVRTLLTVRQRLTDRDATVIVIEHDLGLIANADYVIDMGPDGGEPGGRIVAIGRPEQVARDERSVTGRYLAAHVT